MILMTLGIAQWFQNIDGCDPLCLFRWLLGFCEFYIAKQWKTSIVLMFLMTFGIAQWFQKMDGCDPLCLFRWLLLVSVSFTLKNNEKHQFSRCFWWLLALPNGSIKLMVVILCAFSAGYVVSVGFTLKNNETHPFSRCFWWLLAFPNGNQRLLMCQTWGKHPFSWFFWRFWYFAQFPKNGCFFGCWIFVAKHGCFLNVGMETLLLVGCLGI